MGASKRLCPKAPYGGGPPYSCNSVAPFWPSIAQEVREYAASCAATAACHGARARVAKGTNRLPGVSSEPDRLPTLPVALWTFEFSQIT